MENVKLINGDYEHDFTIVGSPIGFEYPESRVSIADLAGDQSAVLVASKAGKRRISWETIFANETERLNFLKTARLGSLKTLQFTACGLDLQMFIEIERVIAPFRPGRSRGLIEAVAPDWRIYGQELKYITTTQTVITGGFAIPAAIPLDMNGGNGSANNNLQNLGNESSSPYFIITGPGTSFTIGNQTTDEEMVIEYDLAEGETITINPIDRTIKLNDTDNIYSSLVSGDFWLLQPGQNTIRFVAQGLDEDTLLTVLWYDAYVGI